MEAHFGKYVKRLRNRLDLSQDEFAERLGLESREAIYLMERRPEMSVRGNTLERLMIVAGVDSEDALEKLWRSGVLPSVSVRERDRPIDITLPHDLSRRLRKVAAKMKHAPAKVAVDLFAKAIRDAEKSLLKVEETGAVKPRSKIPAEQEKV